MEQAGAIAYFVVEQDGGAIQSVRVFTDADALDAATQATMDIARPIAKKFDITNELTFEGVVNAWSASTGEWR